MKFMSFRRTATRFLLLALLLPTSTCVDAPYTPDDVGLPGAFVLSPSLSLVGPAGPARTPAQGDALAEAFDRVDRFRLQVRRAATGELLLDTTIQVTPGQDSYDLSVDVETLTAGEAVLVTLTAMEGDTELFQAENIPVTAVSEGTPTADTPAPTEIDLTYTGPGATASSVVLEPGQVVLGPGGGAELAAAVLDQNDAVIAGVPIAWSTTAEAVVAVADGVLTGIADGAAEVVATTPTGLEARSWVYVIDGSLAYVEGGVVNVRTAAGGDAQARSTGGGASGPAWGAGDDLLYSQGGQVRRAGVTEPLFDGTWPAVSPGGSKIAAERSGQLVFANDDGSNPTAGPAGTTPAWADGSSLVVGGGSVQSVRADGTDRTTLAEGAATLPAVSPSGDVAYVEGGVLKVVGGNEALATGVTGRPSWSGNGVWLAAPTGDGLVAVPANGGAPPVLLPGLEGATDPAWRRSVPGGGDGTPALTGTDPDPPLPGQAVALVGGGFDWIIPTNNRVFWPTADGSEESTTNGVTATRLNTVMPRGVVAGQIRVENRGGEAVLDFVPTLGGLEVHAATTDGTAVGGVGVSVTNAAGEEVGSGQTDADGLFAVTGLTPGDYTATIEVVAGYAHVGSRVRTVTVGTGVVTIEALLTPLVQILNASPENLEVSVGTPLSVTLSVFDINGNPITSFATSSWTGLSPNISAGGTGLTGTLGGIYPSTTVGDATVGVTLGTQSFQLHATVTSHIAGTIHILDGEETKNFPAHPVVLERDGQAVAKTTTGTQGAYRFDGLLAGTYTVRPDPTDKGTVSPSSATVTLDSAHPTGEADFLVTPVTEGGAGEVIVLGDINYWGSGSSIYEANNLEMTRNFVTNGSRTKTVWYRGHNSWLGGGYGATTYFGETYNYITSTLGQTLEVIASGSSGALTIGDDVASFWIWMPQSPFPTSDVAAIQQYLANGGRVIMMGENNNSTFNTTNQRIQELMASLGSSAIYRDGCFSGTTSEIDTADPLMKDVASISPGCTSYFTLGTGDKALASSSGQPIVIRLRLGPAIVSATSAGSFAPSLLLAPTSDALGLKDGVDPTLREEPEATPFRKGHLR